MKCTRRTRIAIRVVNIVDLMVVVEGMLWVPLCLYDDKDLRMDKLGGG